jgi:hypothetical protein
MIYLEEKNTKLKTYQISELQPLFNPELANTASAFVQFGFGDIKHFSGNITCLM